jgi:hypothetical protein
MVGDIAVLIPIAAILGGIAVAIASIVSKSRIREMEIRERIAMIEKGLVPSPEVDPNGFERAVARQAIARTYDRPLRLSSGRHRRAGIILMGVGFGLMLLIGLAGDEPPARAIGVGGFLAVLGAAFLVNSFFEARTFPPAASRPVQPPVPPSDLPPSDLPPSAS